MSAICIYLYVIVTMVVFSSGNRDMNSDTWSSSMSVDKLATARIPPLSCMTCIIGAIISNSNMGWNSFLFLIWIWSWRASVSMIKGRLLRTSGVAISCHENVKSLSVRSGKIFKKLTILWIKFLPSRYIFNLVTVSGRLEMAWCDWNGISDSLRLTNCLA